MTVTIGLVANIYNEANALPGWLETHLPFFDDVRVLHAGPDGNYSNDGTIEILEKWKIPVEFTSINEGFGVVRTRAIRMSPCDYTMILDADERFFAVHRTMNCSGSATPHSEVDSILQTYDFRDLKTKVPDWNLLKKLGSGLTVEKVGVYNQGEVLRNYLSEQPDAICTIRRHWHDFTFSRPTQNWCTDPDWQLRIIRNMPGIEFDKNVKMHERLTGAVKIVHSDTSWGPFFDHFHFTFKTMEMEQRAHDVAIYDAIHSDRKPPTFTEFNEKLMP